MSAETARKIVVFSALVGSVAIVYTGARKGTATTVTYKRVWGLLILIIGGSLLADFAPAVVGPYMLLVLLGFLFKQQTGLGKLLGEAEQAQTNG